MYIPNFKSSYVPILSDIPVAAGTTAASSKDFSPLNFLSTKKKKNVFANNDLMNSCLKHLLIVGANSY